MQHDTGAGPDGPEAAPPTGDPRVDDALAPLAGLASLPVTEHPQVFERLHGRLVEVLGELGPAAASQS
ncbi:MAG TPA: hypothetical protein VF843_12380 [Streptosporangiaceae bacterium]